jgi:hypothetical protein
MPITDQTPDVVVYNSNGVELTVVDGVAVPIGQPAVPIAGTDGANLRVVKTDATGRVSTLDTTTGTLNNGAQTAVGAAAVQILAANANRKAAIIQNVGAGIMRVGIVGVTATTGLKLEKGATVIFEIPYCPTSAIYAIRDGAPDTTALAQEIT